MMGNKEAYKALTDEAEKLQKKEVWLVNSVKNWNEVRADAKNRGIKAHRSRLFGFVVDKALSSREVNRDTRAGL